MALFLSLYIAAEPAQVAEAYPKLVKDLITQGLDVSDLVFRERPEYPFAFKKLDAYKTYGVFRLNKIDAQPERRLLLTLLKRLTETLESSVLAVFNDENIKFYGYGELSISCDNFWGLGNTGS